VARSVRAQAARRRALPGSQPDESDGGAAPRGRRDASGRRLRPARVWL